MAAMTRFLEDPNVSIRIFAAWGLEVLALKDTLTARKLRFNPHICGMGVRSVQLVKKEANR